jgi:hypothetical protein
MVQCERRTRGNSFNQQACFIVGSVVGDQQLKVKIGLLKVSGKRRCECVRRL